jgi:hypothetical protein
MREEYGSAQQDGDRDNGPTLKGASMWPDLPARAPGFVSTSSIKSDFGQMGYVWRMLEQWKMHPPGILH